MLIVYTLKLALCTMNIIGTHDKLLAMRLICKSLWLKASAKWIAFAWITSFHQFGLLCQELLIVHVKILNIKSNNKIYIYHDESMVKMIDSILWTWSIRGPQWGAVLDISFFMFISRCESVKQRGIFLLYYKMKYANEVSGYICSAWGKNTTERKWV